MLLPERVGSPLSINAVREDLQVAHDTVKQWLDVLERLYVAFHISPYSARLGRAVRKEQKLYLWDYSAIDDDGARFENAVAPSTSLLRLSDKLGIPCVQLVREPKRPVTRGTLTVASAADYFAAWS